MQLDERKYFELLKAELTRKYQAAFPHSSKNIHELKGQEIVNFQEELLKEVGGRISEKWFYTHIRSDNHPRLPRIDVLNMLSEYTGRQNWESFVHEHREMDKTEVLENTIPKAGKRAPVILLTGILLLGVVVLSAVMSSASRQEVLRFCFVDADDGKPLTDDVVVHILNQGETPSVQSAEENGCINLTLLKEDITFLVKAPYYRDDTIVRSKANYRPEEQIQLRKDDYALMIHYFSTANLEDWKKRREQLSKMFVDEVRIFQVSEGDQLGMEMYTREEFIDKMTMPLKSLRNIEILETVYLGDQIIEMRFIQKGK